MIRAIGLTLSLLALSACVQIREEAYPTRSISFDRGETAYTVTARYDPLTFQWFTRVWSVDRKLTAEDRDEVLAVVAGDAGPVICDGDPLEIGTGEVINPLAGEKVMFLDTVGEWQVVGSCA